MDITDKAIIKELQRNCAASVSEIADAVGLSATPCWRRIKKLEEDGVISARVAIANRTALNLGLTAFVAVRAGRHDENWLKNFSEKVSLIPEIVEIHRMSGDTDYLMKVVCPDMARFDIVYKRLISLADFADVTSNFSMEELKYTTELPTDYA